MLEAKQVTTMSFRPLPAQPLINFKKNIVFPKASYVKQYDTNNSSFRYNCLRDETSCMEAFKECILLEKQQYLMMEQKAHSEI
jgi:hypothetical protein